MIFDVHLSCSDRQSERVVVTTCHEVAGMCLSHFEVVEVNFDGRGLFVTQIDVHITRLTDVDRLVHPFVGNIIAGLLRCAAYLNITSIEEPKVAVEYQPVEICSRTCAGGCM